MAPQQRLDFANQYGLSEDVRESIGAPRNQEAVNSMELDARIQKFLDFLNQPLDLKDPHIQSILTGARQSAETSARQAGIEGGMATAASEQNTAGALSSLEAQRQARYQQGLGLASQRDIAGRQLSQQRELGLAALAENQFQYDDAAAQQRAMGGGATLGGIIGAALPIAAAPFTGGASLSFVGDAYKAGSSIGAGVGGSSYRSPSRSGYRGRGGL